MHISDRVRRQQLLSSKHGSVSLSDLPADLPLSLKEVCERVFGGSISVASLKAEHRRGNLEITKIGRAYFTTPADLKAMLAKCRVASRRRFAASPMGSPLQAERSNEAYIEAARASAKLAIARLRATGKKKCK
jgi:hypothetical protein